MFQHRKSLWLFLLPGLAGVMVFYIVPFIGGMYYSFTDGSWENRFVWFDNYARVWSNSMFRLGLVNSMLLSVICAPLVWALGFFLAILLNRLKEGGHFFRNSMMMPYVMPSSAILLIWLLLFDYGGPVNRLLSVLTGSRVQFLSGVMLRVPVVLLFVWKNLGFAVVIYLSAMQTVPEPLYEYATLEGAGFWKQSFLVTLPQVLPTCFLVMILEWVNAFRIFREVYFIGGAYPDYEVYTLQNYMNNMYAKLNYQNVTTAAYSFALIVFAVFGLLFLAQKKTLRALEGADA